MAWKKTVDWIAMALTFIGAIAWGIIGLFSFNIVEWIFSADWLAKTIYILVGVSALWLAAKGLSK